MLLRFRRKIRTVFKNLIMILMISGVVVTRKEKKHIGYKKGAVKEPKEFQDDGLQIHGHTYEGKYEVAYFLFKFCKF